MNESLQLKIIVFLNGAVILALEILGSRIFAPYFGSTIYTWSALIIITLGALSIGYHLGGVKADSRANFGVLSNILIQAGILIAIIPLLKLISPNMANLFGIRWGALVAALIVFSAPNVYMGMILPIATKMFTPDMKSLGHSVGDLYAIATVGSIVGAFTVVFLLIPYIGITKIVALLSLTLFACALPGARMLKGKRYLVLALVLVVVGYVSVGTMVQSTSYKIIYHTNSEYNDIKVIESSDARYLLLDNIKQSATYLTHTPGSRYEHMFLDGKKINPKASSILFLGLGAGEGPRLYRYNHPNMNIEVVEIDPKVVETAKKYFWPLKDTKAHINDARAFLTLSEEKYDIIVVDVYSGATVPIQTTTMEFVMLAKEHLTSDGIIFINLLGTWDGETSKFWRSQFKTYNQVFKNVAIKGVENSSGLQNIILVASDSKPIDGIKDINIKDVPILTDEYTPVEALTIPIIEKEYEHMYGW